MIKKLEEEDVVTLIKSLDDKMHGRPDALPQFFERQVLRELKRRDLTILSEQDRKLVNFANSRDKLFEKERDLFKTRDMDVVGLLRKLLENLRNDFYRSRYIKELDIRQEEGELTAEQQLTLQQLKDDIREGVREDVERIKKGMKEFVEGMEGKGEKFN